MEIGMKTHLVTCSYRIKTIKEYLKKHDDLLIFSLSFLIEILFGLFLIIKYGSTIFDFDSISYLYNARNVIDKGEYSGLAAIVGTWLPFFQLVLVPFVAIDRFYTTGFAGAIVNAAMTAGTCVFLYRIAGGIKNKFALLVPIIFMSNIYVLIYGAIPMSEQAAVFIVTAATYYFKQYLDTGKLNKFITCSAILILGTLTRYEIWVIALYVVAIFIIKEVKNNNIHRLGYAHLPLMGIPAWLALNYIIHKDAFWWNKNPLALGVNNIISLYPELFYFKNSLYLTLDHAWFQMTMSFGPLLYLAVISCVSLLIMKRSKDLIPYVIFFIPAAVTIVLMFIGKSVGWQRYFYTAIPGIIILTVLLFQNIYAIYHSLDKTTIKKAITMRQHYNLYFILAIIVIFVISASGAFPMDKSDVKFIKTDIRPWLFQGLDMSNERIFYKLEFNGTAYKTDLDFYLVNTLPVNDLNKVKNVIGNDKILLPYPDPSGYTPNVFSVWQGISPSQIIDDFNYLEYEQIMEEPWKHVTYVLLPNSSGTSAIVNKWYRGTFYPYNYYYNETWRSEFLDRYEPVLDDLNFKLFKLKVKGEEI